MEWISKCWKWPFQEISITDNKLAGTHTHTLQHPQRATWSSRVKYHSIKSFPTPPFRVRAMYLNSIYTWFDSFIWNFNCIQSRDSGTAPAGRKGHSTWCRTQVLRGNKFLRCSSVCVCFLVCFLVCLFCRVSVVQAFRGTSIY